MTYSKWTTERDANAVRIFTNDSIVTKDWRYFQ